MLRQSLKSTETGLNPDFTYRGLNQTRLETFSDAVFALAVTLLVLSSTVPETYAELISTFHDLIPFGVCITMLVVIWYQHYLFFVRYGLQDVLTVVLNTVLLFLVLFYVYPLKFLFKLLYQMFFNQYFGNWDKNLFEKVIALEDTPSLMAIYAVGAVAIFLSLASLYYYALVRRAQLNLSPKEIFDTRSSVYHNLVMCVPPFLSTLIVLITPESTRTTFTLAGLIYWVYPLLMPLYSLGRARFRRKHFARAPLHTEEMPANV